jgi:TolA-binding protein
MAYCPRWILVLLAFVMSGGQLLAASHEERAFAEASKMYRDQLYAPAKERLTQFLQTYRKSTNAPAALLLLAQSDFYLKDFAAVTNRLGDAANLSRARMAGLADRYIYWQAEAEFASGDYDAAARTFISLADSFPGSPLALNAAVEASAALEKMGQWQQVSDLLGGSNTVFQRSAHGDPANSVVADGRLLQSEAKLIQNDFSGALEALSYLNPATLSPMQDWKRAYLMYRANLRLNDLDAALAATTNMLALARAGVGHGDAWPTNLAESVSDQANVLERQGRLAEASAALRENLGDSVPGSSQQQAILKLADLALAQKNLAEAEAGLEKFLADFPNSSAAQIALLTLGDLNLKDFVLQPLATNHLVAAQTILDQFLGNWTNSPLAGKAYLGRGWCEWLSQRYVDSFEDFQAAAKLLPVSEDLAVARFKMGDAQFALSEFQGAQTNYEAIFSNFSSLPEVTNALGGRALYQILRARLALHDADGVAKSMASFLDRFFTNCPAESGLLLAGEGFSDFDSPSRARQVFERFASEYGDSPLMPQVAFAVARTYAQETNWPEAIRHYQAWLKAYPANDIRMQVDYARNWAVSQTGDEGAAFELFTNFASQYTNETLTPLADWWIGDHFFRLGGTNLLSAEIYYQAIFQMFPSNDLAPWAMLSAGRAALARSQPEEAISLYLRRLVDNANASPDLAVQARFAYCEAERFLHDTNNLNLQTATNILSQICTMYPTNLPGAMAWCEMGDCDLQLLAYDNATNAYSQTLQIAASSPALRNRANVGIGVALEKKAEGMPDDIRKGLLDLALQYYASAFYSDADAKDEFWRKKAGMQLLQLGARTGLLKGKALDNFVAEMKDIFPQLGDSWEFQHLPPAD